MGGWNVRVQDDGPITFEAMVNVLGGQLLIPHAGATTDPSLAGVGLATDAALTVVGVANKDAIAAANRAALESGSTAYGGGFVVTDVAVPDATVVASNDAVGYFTFTTATAFGDPICAANNAAAGNAAAPGKVRKWLTGTDDPAAIIGSCQQPGGVGVNGTGLARVRTH